MAFPHHDRTRFESIGRTSGVFELLDHPTSRKCYAWEVDGEVTAVLHEAPVRSAQDAVRASIVEGGGE